jgi:hypothetical protein
VLAYELEELDPSDVIIDFVHSDGVYRHDGTIAELVYKSMGACFFKYPKTHIRLYAKQLRGINTIENFCIWLLNHEYLHHYVNQQSEYPVCNRAHFVFAAGLDDCANFCLGDSKAALRDFPTARNFWRTNK